MAAADDDEPEGLRGQGPTQCVSYQDSDKQWVEKWVFQGKDNRERVLREEWGDDQGRSHRKNDLPAQRSFYRESGNLMRARWIIHGKEHRDGDRPACVRYADSGNVLSEIWKTNGRRHRDGGFPAVLAYDPVSGDVTREEWWVEGIEIQPQTPIKPTRH